MTLEVRKGFPRLPLDGRLDITYRCNNKCLHCWLWQPNDASQVHEELTTEEINRIAMIAPQATINIIREFRIHQKTRITIPDEIVGIVQCQNPSCITNNERGIFSNFKVEDRNPVTLRCMYCKRITDHDHIVEQLLGEK